MDLTRIIESRCSCRSFTDQAVTKEQLKELVRLAGLAPSVNNSQPWKFVAIVNTEMLKCMADAVRAKLNNLIPDANDEVKQTKNKVEWFSTFFADAPAVIAVLSKPYEAVADKALGVTHLTHQDINQMRGYPDIQSLGAAVQNILLAATDIGLGSCWLSGPLVAREELEKCLKAEEPWHLSAMVAIGYPKIDCKQQEKKSVDEIFEILA